MVGALASGPIGPSCFCRRPPSHVIEVDDVRIHCPLIGCGVKEQHQGRFLSWGFRWAFCKASMKAEEVAADEFSDCVSALSVIHQLFKVSSHQQKKKCVAKSRIILNYFQAMPYLFIYFYHKEFFFFFSGNWYFSFHQWKPECVNPHTSAWRPWS